MIFFHREITGVCSYTVHVCAFIYLWCSQYPRKQSRKSRRSRGECRSIFLTWKKSNEYFLNRFKRRRKWFMSPFSTEFPVTLCRLKQYPCAFRQFKWYIKIIPRTFIKCVKITKCAKRVKSTKNIKQDFILKVLILNTLLRSFQWWFPVMDVYVIINSWESWTSKYKL